MHRFGFVCLWRLGRFGGRGEGGCGEALAPGTRSEDVDVLDFASLQLRWIGAGGSHFQVHFLNPPTRREKKQMRFGPFAFSKELVEESASLKSVFAVDLW